MTTTKPDAIDRALLAMAERAPMKAGKPDYLAEHEAAILECYNRDISAAVIAASLSDLLTKQEKRQITISKDMVWRFCADRGAKRKRAPRAALAADGDGVTPARRTRRRGLHAVPSRAAAQPDAALPAGTAGEIRTFTRS
jgi:hypothetical protein